MQRSTAAHTYHSATKSLCSRCKRAVDAKFQFVDGGVILAKYCPEHGHERAVVSSSVEWWLDAMTFVAPSTPPAETPRPVKDGCPFDCGFCPQHAQPVVLPVVPITSACNLDCPVCYTVNRNEDAYRITREDFAGVLERLRASHGDLDIINFTGGEPTMHPELAELLRMSRAAGIRRLTVSTNGLRLLGEETVRELADCDARIVLSLDTLDPETDRTMVGADTVAAKLRCLDLLGRFDVTTTILPAVAAGLNDREVPALLDLVLSRPHICSLELHTMAFTGQGGAGFDRNARITIPDLHRRFAEATRGRITAADFVPSPLAHPHCYSICYLLLLDGGGWVPYTRFMPRAKLYELLSTSLYVQAGEKAEEILRWAVDELWASPERPPEGDAILRTLRRLLDEMFPPGGLDWRAQQRIAERASKAIYIHSHMDEETFDVSRVMRCGVAVPEADGTNVPTCAYNVLYRERDPRFANPRRLPAIRSRS